MIDVYLCCITRIYCSIGLSRLTVLVRQTKAMMRADSPKIDLDNSLFLQKSGVIL